MFDTQHTMDWSDNWIAQWNLEPTVTSLNRPSGVCVRCSILDKSYVSCSSKKWNKTYCFLVKLGKSQKYHPLFSPKILLYWHRYFYTDFYLQNFLLIFTNLDYDLKLYKSFWLFYFLVIQFFLEVLNNFWNLNFEQLIFGTKISQKKYSDFYSKNSR